MEYCDKCEKELGVNENVQGIEMYGTNGWMGNRCLSCRQLKHVVEDNTYPPKETCDYCEKELTDEDSRMRSAFIRLSGPGTRLCFMCLNDKINKDVEQVNRQAEKYREKLKPFLPIDPAPDVKKLKDLLTKKSNLSLEDALNLEGINNHSFGGYITNQMFATKRNVDGEEIIAPTKFFKDEFLAKYASVDVYGNEESERLVLCRATSELFASNTATFARTTFKHYDEMLAEAKAYYAKKTLPKNVPVTLEEMGSMVGLMAQYVFNVKQAGVITGCDVCGYRINTRDKELYSTGAHTVIRGTNFLVCQDCIDKWRAERE